MGLLEKIKKAFGGGKGEEKIETPKEEAPIVPPVEEEGVVPKEEEPSEEISE